MSNTTIITCLGHGGAFAHPDVGHTAYLVERGKHRILVDCGSTVPDVLKEFDISPGSLTAILISHLHADHVGGLERILYHRHYGCKSDPIPVISGQRVIESWMSMVHEVQNDLLRHSKPLIGPRLDLADDLKIDIREVNHGGDVPNMACYCFKLIVGGKEVFFSGDRVWDHKGAEQIRMAMKWSSLAFHEIDLNVPPSNNHTNVADAMSFEPRHHIWWGHHGRSDRNAPEAHGLNLAMRGDQWIFEADGKVTHKPHGKCS